jgi:hypothetical protein
MIPVPVVVPEVVLLAPWTPALIPKLACLAEALGPATRPAVFADVPFDCGALAALCPLELAPPTSALATGRAAPKSIPAAVAPTAAPAKTACRIKPDGLDSTRINAILNAPVERKIEARTSAGYQEDAVVRIGETTQSWSDCADRRGVNCRFVRLP